MWKSFHEDKGPNGYTALMRKAERKEIKKTASALTIAKGEKETKHAKDVEELLQDPTATTFLKEFLTKTGDQTSLLFCESQTGMVWDISMRSILIHSPFNTKDLEVKDYQSLYLNICNKHLHDAPKGEDDVKK